MKAGPASFYVPNHQLTICPPNASVPEQDDPVTDPVNGLIEVYQDWATIVTGIASGRLYVEAETREEAPADVELDGWDDIVEVSIELRQPGTRIGTDEDLGPENWPILNAQGPGWYRLRAHCRGRDLDYDDVPLEPREHHKIIIWLAEPTAAILHKLTDSTGAYWREG